jgi:GH24 family phage-related lysozyme (muramidase)
MAGDYLEQSLAKLKEFEGCIPWMYRDIAGNVTVGVGLMLSGSDAAQSLPFLTGFRAATPQEIAADFTRVNTLPPGHASGFYKSPSSLELSQQTIDAKLSGVIKNFEIGLRARLPQYDAFPDGIKMALLDMIYNLGPEGLFKGFPHFIAAVEAQSWAQAAEDCLRHGPNPARNAWTRQQFLDAVVGTIQAEAESIVTRFERWLRHIFSGLLRLSK